MKKIIVCVSLAGTLLLGGSIGWAASSALKNQPHLDHTVKIYIPTKDQNGNVVIQDGKPLHGVKVDEAITNFSNWYGGATAIDGQGGWLDNNGNLEKEPVTIVYSFTNKNDDHSLNTLVEYAQKIKKDMNQSSVSIEVDGKMYFE